MLATAAAATAAVAVAGELTKTMFLSPQLPLLLSPLPPPPSLLPPLSASNIALTCSSALTTIPAIATTTFSSPEAAHEAASVTANEKHDGGGNSNELCTRVFCSCIGLIRRTTYLLSKHTHVRPLRYLTARLVQRSRTRARCANTTAARVTPTPPNFK